MYRRLILHDLMDKRLPDSTNVGAGTGSQMVDWLPDGGAVAPGTPGWLQRRLPQGGGNGSTGQRHLPSGGDV
jgi:hypothetical protein